MINITTQAVLLAALFGCGLAHAERRYDVKVLPLERFEADDRSISATALNSRGRVSVAVHQPHPDFPKPGFTASAVCTTRHCKPLPPILSPDQKPYRNRINALNDLGDVVGSLSQAEKGRAYVLSAGVVTNIGPLNDEGHSSWATGINNAREVAGTGYIDAYRRTRAFHWANGVLTILPTLGGQVGSGNKINDAGQIVGSSSTASGYLHATVWTNGVPSDLGTNGGLTSKGLDINRRGDAVGCATNENGRERAFVHRDGSMTDLGVLSGHVVSCAYGVNDKGYVVGTSEGEFMYPTLGFIWMGAGMVDLNSLLLPERQSTYEVVHAIDINNRDEIVAFVWHKLEGKYLNVLLTPVS